MRLRVQQKVVLLSIQCLASSILAAAQISACGTSTFLCCTTVEPLNPGNILSLEQLIPISVPPPQGNVGLGCSAMSPIDIILGPCTGTLTCCTEFVPEAEIAVGCEPPSVLGVNKL